MASPEIIGLIRFSFIGEETGGTASFAKTFNSLDEKRQFIYDKERLNRRIDIFEAITLPSLIKQVDQNFRFLLLVGLDFPIWALDRLNSLIKGSCVSICKKPFMPIKQAIEECFDEHFSADCTMKITMRLDDDDAISLGWIAHLHKTAEMFDLHKQSIDCFASYLLDGVALHNCNPDGDFGIPLVPLRLKSPWSVGPVLFAKANCKDNIYTHSHGRIMKLYPSFLVPSNERFLRCFHGENDSTQAQTKPKILAMLKSSLSRADIEEIANDFVATFGIDIEKAVSIICEEVDA